MSTAQFENFEDYFKSELQKADASRAEVLGKDFVSTRKIWDGAELEKMRDPRTGKPFNIINLEPLAPDYVSGYIMAMDFRVNHPFQFWSQMMFEKMPTQEMEYLISIGVLSEETLKTEENK